MDQRDQVLVFPGLCKSNVFAFVHSVLALVDNYSRLPITRTFKENRKKIELSGVRLIGSSKKIAGNKEKRNSFTAQ